MFDGSRKEGAAAFGWTVVGKYTTDGDEESGWVPITGKNNSPLDELVKLFACRTPGTEFSPQAHILPTQEEIVSAL